MFKKEFQYKLSNIDMKNLYNDILCYDIKCPAVIVFEELEDGSKILRKEMANGNHLIYLKNDKNMFDTLLKELEMNKARVVPALPFENHNLSDEEVMTWILCAYEIADMLNIRCPQIVFISSFEDAGNFVGQGLLHLPDIKPYGKLNVVEMFVNIAHELRHEWQYENHPEWNEGYVHVESEEDMEMYRNHRAEIDAEAYARKLAGIVFGVQLFIDREPSIIEKLTNRAMEIDIPISEDTIEYFNAIFDTDEWE